MRKFLVVLVIAVIVSTSLSGCSGCSKKNDTVTPPVTEAILFLGGTQDPKRRGDVVFVHGLGGEVRDTWRGADLKFFWPEELGKQFKDIGVWSVAYNAAPSAWLGGTMPLTDRSKAVIEQLRLAKLGDRPVIYVCHSLGGLVVKQVLKEAFTQNKSDWEEIGDNTAGVFFLATPHTGSGVASFMKSFSLITRATITLSELEANAAPLRDLNVWYRQNIPERNIKTAVLYENRPDARVNMLVVDESSSDPGLPGAIPIRVDTDHEHICKPRDANDVVYKHVADFIAKNLTPAGPPYDISFIEFNTVYGVARKNAATLADFQKEHLTQTIKWKAFVRRVSPHDKEPSLAISPLATSPVTDYHQASFAPYHFDKDIPLDSEIEIEGTIKKLNSNGAILHKCKIVAPRPNK